MRAEVSPKSNMKNLKSTRINYLSSKFINGYQWDNTYEVYIHWNEKLLLLL